MNSGRYLPGKREYVGLTRSEEIRLAKAWRDHGDVDARNRLIESHLSLSSSRARKKGRGRSDLEDMEQEAALALFSAVDRFDPDLGWRFSTYASWWIMASIQGYIFKNHSMVHIPNNMYRKIFFSLRKTREKIIAQARNEGVEMTPGEVTAEAARLLCVPIEEIEKFETIILKGDQRLNEPAWIDASEDVVAERIDSLESPSPTPEQSVISQDVDARRGRLIEHALAQLKPRERMVIESRRLCDEDDRKTLADLGEVLGVSRERVRQIEMSAIKKIESAINHRRALKVLD